MSQPPSHEQAPHGGPVAPVSVADRSEKKRDPKTLSLVGAGMLTILASVITLFVDKLSLPLYVSLMIGLFWYWPFRCGAAHADGPRALDAL